jgi:hypothetical protein
MAPLGDGVLSLAHPPWGSDKTGGFAPTELGVTERPRSIDGTIRCSRSLARGEASVASDSRRGSPASLPFQGAAHTAWVVESEPSDRQAVSGGSGSPEASSALAATPGAG